MFFVAAVLTILSGLFYAAGYHEIGPLGVAMRQCRSPLCENPLLALVAARLGRARSSACADALVRRLANVADEAAMPVICPTCQTARFTAAPGSPGERALAWVAQAPPAASIQSA